MRDKFDLIVMKLDMLGKRKRNPHVYTDHEIDDTREAVESFFENASIEAGHAAVPRIAKELDADGYSYWNNEFLFNLV